MADPMEDLGSGITPKGVAEEGPAEDAEAGDSPGIHGRLIRKAIEEKDDVALEQAIKDCVEATY